MTTGRLVRLACERHLRDRAEGSKRGLHFNENRALHAIEFFPEFLRHNEGLFADKPFNLTPHQKFIVGSLFGWLKADGYRRFRHAYIEEGKGAGKTPLASGMALYGLTMDGESGAEIYTAAVTRDQAGIAFKDCVHMAEKSIFADRLTIGSNNIAFEQTNSFIRPVSSEAKSLDGKRVSFVILDEVHEHPTPLVVDKMTAGFKGRTQPIAIEITNSGYDRTSICWEHHEYSRLVLEQVYEDDTWFCYVCQLDPCASCVEEGKSSPQDECEGCDKWWEEKNWCKTNPNIGLSVTWEYLRSEVAKALRMPSKALIVKRLNFCIWTEQATHWIPMDDWDACSLPQQPGHLRDLLRTEAGVAPLRLRNYLKGRRCFAGLDLADTIDTASLVLVFPPAKIPMRVSGDNQIPLISHEDLQEPFIILPFIWLPQEMKKRTAQDRTRFEKWASEGLMTLTPGNLIDYRYILDTIGQCRQDYNLRMLAFDRWGSSKITTDLCDEFGFTVDAKEAKNYHKPLLVQFGQGFASMNSPTKELSNLAIAHKIVHGGHAVLRWMVGNVVITQDGAGNQKPDKGKSVEKIDAAVSAIMALDLALRNLNADDDESVYERRGLVTL